MSPLNMPLVMRHDQQCNQTNGDIIMGTNYYLHQKGDCECCGRPFEAIHIGKSSYGWCFALHVIPNSGINTFKDWRALWNKPSAIIRDEYDRVISVEELENVITVREWNGLLPLRNEIDGHHCIGHGEGSWDYCIGEFS